MGDSCHAAATRGSSPLSDLPITALHCTLHGTVYFAAGNVVYRNVSAAVAPCAAAATLPLLDTSMCVLAPASTVITSLAVAHCDQTLAPQRALTRTGEDGDAEAAQMIVFIGAADRLLAQLVPCTHSQSGDIAHVPKPPTMSQSSTTASSFGCRCVLQSAESRVLRIAVDEERRTVVVLSALNDVYLLKLDDVAEALRTTVSPTSPPYQDLSEQVRHTRVCGPSLGVVLAADILMEDVKVQGDVLASEAVADTVPCADRVFAATYSGEVVEWSPLLTNASDAPAQLQHRAVGEDAHHTVGYRVVSRVQAHPRGCAIFAVRVEQSQAPRNSSGDDMSSRAQQQQQQQRTHLVTCSDDRTVALYERRLSSPVTIAGKEVTATALRTTESEWVLLWRGGGTAFSKSRIFDAALCAVWRAKCDPAASPASTARWSCAVQVAAAGEDGCVQVTCVERTSHLGEVEEARQLNVSGDVGTNVSVSSCFVRARQHRGHGAYRVAFCRSTQGQTMRLLSGGFDGVVLAHTYALRQREEGIAAAVGASAFDTSQFVSEAALPGTSNEASGLCHHAATAGASGKAAQVRVVHVDAAGHVIACTGEKLCVQLRGGGGGGAGAGAGAAAPPRWQTRLPSLHKCGTCTGEEESCTGEEGVRPSAPDSYGLPTCAQSFDMPLAPAVPEENGIEVTGRDNVAVTFAVVGTTTGVLYAVPYLCSSADSASLDGSVRCACPVPSSVHGAPKWASFTATAALQWHGKVTHIAVLADEKAEEHTLLVASSHVRNVVVLTALRLSCVRATAAEITPTRTVDVVGEWHPLSVYQCCPGPLTTALSLLPTHGAGAAAISFWLLVGDRHGCVQGEHCVVSSTRHAHTSPLPSGPGCADSTGSAHIAATTTATVRAYVFPEHLHIAIAAFCEEESAVTLGDLDCAPVCPTSPHASSTVLRVAGNGGVLEYLCLPRETLHDSKGAAVGSREPCAKVPQPAQCREPLRLPFDASAVLAMSSRVCVTQSGTTVSVFHRLPGRAAWVLVDAHDNIRAPRLLTARVHEKGFLRHYSSRDDAVVVGSCPCVTLAHCSDGHTVESVASFPDQLHLLPGTEASVHTTLLHGGGLPGKDYNCVTYAPAPLDCLLLGCEDSSLVVVSAAASCSSTSPQVLPPSPCEVISAASPSTLLRRLLVPVNVCGAHHSNILSIAVLPPVHRCSGVDSLDGGSHAVRFVSVGGGAMVNLWSSDCSASPLRLVDWWCGGEGGDTTTPSVEGEEDEDEAVQSGASVQPRVSSARFQKRRVKQAQAAAAPSSLSSAALAERVARFMCVAPLDAHTFVVGSSDGTVLVFRVDRGVSARSGVRDALRLEWQGLLNAEHPKPILCISSNTATTTSLSNNLSVRETGSVREVIVAGDTNGHVYVVDAATRCVLVQRRLEQSAVNAVSEVHMTGTSAWRFAAMHDSGNVHLIHVDVASPVAPTDTAATLAAMPTQLAVLGSASTGVTAGRSVRWPHPMQPIVAVSEERITQLDPCDIRGGALAVFSSRRVNVRCVSGAVLVPDASPHGIRAASAAGTSRVAVVGQGFEVV